MARAQHVAVVPLWTAPANTSFAGSEYASASGVLYSVVLDAATSSGCPSGGCGHIYAVTPPAAGQTSWSAHAIAAFNKNDGLDPNAPLIADGSGALYGTTEDGGTHGAGTVFRLAPPAPPSSAWTLATLWNFTGGADGRFPVQALTLAGGVLYGTTIDGGTNSDGVVFSLAPPKAGSQAWQQKVLWNFTGGSDGSGPSSPLRALDRNHLVGITFYGGAGNFGTAFELTRAGKPETWSYAQIAQMDGVLALNPVGKLIADRKGSLYGASFSGGIKSSACSLKSGCGTIFKLTPPAAGTTQWTLSDAYQFTGGKDGAEPDPSLAIDSKGAIFGIAFAAGPSGRGAVFKPQAGAITPIVPYRPGSNLIATRSAALICNGGGQVSEIIGSGFTVK